MNGFSATSPPNRRQAAPAVPGVVALLVSLLLLVSGLNAAEEPAERIVVRMVSRDGTLISDMEELQPIVRTLFDETGTRTEAVGERATLWVRNANVDGKFTFERYHQGKYISRSAELGIDRKELGVGKHTINPGGHTFELLPDGTLKSDDPEITIDGNTVTLETHRVRILPVDAGKTGPPEYRLVGANIGLLLSDPKTPVTPGNLPEPKQLKNMLSHSRAFYPLTIYLPSNTIGQGYVLYPSWQAFHLTPDGKVDTAAGKIEKVPGIETESDRIVIPHRIFRGAVNSKTGLSGGVGNVRLRDEMLFSPTLEKLKFVAAVGQPDENFFMSIDNDLSRLPNKFFLADNTTDDPAAIRMLALEWAHPVYTQATTETVALRFMQTPDRKTVHSPVARLFYCRYRPSSPDRRDWRDLGRVPWKDGKVTFEVPDVPYDFYVFRLTVLDANSRASDSPLSAEWRACIIRKGQTGTASLISPKGRTAFVIGEQIDLDVVFRSSKPRTPGQRTVLLTGPEGIREQIKVQDDGQAWCSRRLNLSPAATRHLPPGQYSVTIRDLPETVAPYPFTFDLAPDQKTSLFKVVKPSKYTKPMNELATSHSGRKGVKAINLDRAVETLAELGYNRVDLMTYRTDHHVRPHAWRERLASSDPRLMAAGTVYTPAPRDQILNACVRNRIEFSDVFLSYNDFHLPRRIEGYIQASMRWIKREMASMRHSPALAGMMLYDEMYESAVTGIVGLHQKLFPRIRAELAEKELGLKPDKVKAAMSRYIARPRNQRDPEALRNYLRYGRWQRHGWGDYNQRVADAAREVVPRAKMGTYHRTWMSPGNATGTINGWPPDVFEGLDIVSHVHYADNSTGWVHSSIIASALRFGPHKPLFVNIPVTHEQRGHLNGEYQRHMAFAMLAQGADGVSLYGLPHSFENGPNPSMVAAKETTRILNRDILVPFGELTTRTEPGYRNVGIVSTLNQHLLDEFKPIGVAHQTEELWIACWRLGYPAQFLHEDAFEQPLKGYQIIFVPGIRFDGELDPKVVERLKEAIAEGTKVVVEKGSTLDLQGVIKLEEMTLLNFFLRNYFPTWYDDELQKIFEKSQITTDYLREKLPELGIEPAAKGDFKVGPNWRSSDSIHYLVMANFNDPAYNHVIKQIMADPVRMPLHVPAHRGNVAYDLLAQQPMPLKRKGDELALTLDMTRIEGALVAFLPEPVKTLQVRLTPIQDKGRVRITADLLGAAGKTIPGVFPTRIRMLDQSGKVMQEYYRVLGNNNAAQFTLPAATKQDRLTIEVREAISGKTFKAAVDRPALKRPLLTVAEPRKPFIPYPREITDFLRNTKQVVIVASDRVPEFTEFAQTLAAALKDRGIQAAVRPEEETWRFPGGDRDKVDPMNDGFHSWRKGHEIIQPATVVDLPTIIISCHNGSYLLDGLVTNGFITFPPAGGPEKPLRPSMQVAPRGLHWKYDTLCLIANDATGMERLVQALLSGRYNAEEPQPQQQILPPDGLPKISEAAPAEAREESRITPLMDFMGNTEQIEHLQFDENGNLYIATWGHGNNLHSLSPTGKLRFSRHLPEMGTSRIQVESDRVLAFTSAGSRLYQLTPEGKPVSQMRLTMDPGPIGDEGYRLSYVPWAYLPEKQAVLVKTQAMRLIDMQGRVLHEWRGEDYVDKDVSDHTMKRGQRNWVLSPDRKRIAQIESTKYFTRSGYKDMAVFDTHLVVRDLTGKLLHEFKNISNHREKIEVDLKWPADAPGPCVVAKEEIWQFDEKLKHLYTRGYDPGQYSLGGLKRLVRDGNCLRYLDGEKPEICRMGPFEVMPTFARLSPDGNLIALLDEYGTLHIHEARSGKRLQTLIVPQLGKVLRFSPDGKRLYLGGLRGLVLCCDVSGKKRWTVDLSQFNDSLADPPLYDPSFKDFTSVLWPESRPEPGELDKMVRMGKNRLANSNCESSGGWRGEASYGESGHKSRRALLVGPEPVHQDVEKYLGNHVTWVLEFFYKAAPRTESPRLLAGLLVQSEHSDSLARYFSAGSDWRFARLVVKSGKNCERIRAGFQTSSGEVLIDDITLRQIRFPSINHLLYEPFHEIDPVILLNPLFSESYDPVGNVRQDAAAQVTIPPYTSGGKPLMEPVFLQNGRLNELSNVWYEMPFSRETSRFPISMTLSEPRWVSLVALYFNAYDMENVVPHFDIWCLDVEKKKEVLVASVRNNTEAFRLVKFPPVKAAQVRLELVNSIKRYRTVTELELYGPLSGRETTAGFADPRGQNTYMGNFARVDKRTKSLPELYGSPALKRHRHGDRGMLWSVPCTQILVSEDRFYVSRVLGHNEMYTLDEPTEPKTQVRTSGLGYTPYATLYGGLLLKCGNRGRLYCIDADTGRKLWAVRIGQRPTGSPVVIEEDVFVANRTDTLYKLDLANGSIMMEVKLSGGVHGSIATDGKHLYLITHDGKLQCIEADGGRTVWTAPLAPWTESTPAIDGGRIYLADQKGNAGAFDAGTGKRLWSTPLGQEFNRCPVVLPQHVLFGCRDGKLAALDRKTGKVTWALATASRFEYEPVVLDEHVLFFDDKAAKLARLSDGEVSDLQYRWRHRRNEEIKPFTLPDDPMLPISYYRGKLFLVPRHGDSGHTDMRMNHPWHVLGGSFYVLSPEEPKPEPKKENKKSRKGKK